MRNTYGYKFYCRESKKNKEGQSKVEMSITVNPKTTATYYATLTKNTVVNEVVAAFKC